MGEPNDELRDSTGVLEVEMVDAVDWKEMDSVIEAGDIVVVEVVCEASLSSNTVELSGEVSKEQKSITRAALVAFDEENKARRGAQESSFSCEEVDEVVEGAKECEVVTGQSSDLGVSILRRGNTASTEEAATALEDCLGIPREKEEEAEDLSLEGRCNSGSMTHSSCSISLSSSEDVDSKEESSGPHRGPVLDLASGQDQVLSSLSNRGAVEGESPGTELCRRPRHMGPPFFGRSTSAAISYRIKPRLKISVK